MILCLLTALSLLTGFSQAQPQIRGTISLDTTRWAPMAYLSAIPDFNQLHSVSNESIILRSGIDPSGRFVFDCRKLPPEDRLYRIHFSRKGDPPATLIIGGAEENHLFVVANSRSELDIRIPGGPKMLSGVTISGYAPDNALLEINQIAGFLDTLDYYGPAVNRDFVRQAVYDRLRRYADTCSNPLISLYALYHSRFEPDLPGNKAFYKNYLRKWKNEDSEYFRVFRAGFPDSHNQVPWIPLSGMAAILIAAGVLFLMRHRRKPLKNPYQSLTVQERKIFTLLKDGRSNKEISEECGISLSTVKSHVNNIYSKLGIKSRTDVMDYDNNP
jgi:DNA-binding CsgD family transcriptional regulator